MISRRNIRVKVMQLLYVIESTGEQTAIKNPVDELHKQFDKSSELFISLLYYITEVARYAEVDAKQRASKNIPTYEDLNINIKIAGNELIWKILESSSYKKLIEQFKPENFIDREWVRKSYNELVETNEYKTYIALQSREPKQEKEILEFIFTHIVAANEIIESYFEEKFANWQDDIEMIGQLVMQYLQKPTTNITQMMTKDKWEYAKTLLTTVLDKKKYTLELINPKLKNWDADRVALLDMIILQMGICELLYFETIPTKVTINEYIDLAKDYSTPQSGQFVNGILDNIHKELTATGKIHKIEFKNRKA
ncbi:MAG: transcription antitermination factor NusB [Bacteroidetes bacterium]|nr:transcription antitermination factor NusB [Bacteroidota bacterium]MBS1649575.1 transcription antitermination factor NusB [Bacteroidota bacterium]